MDDTGIEGDGTQIRNCKFAFKCPKVWADLRETYDPGIRHCNNCAKLVYRCTTDQDIARAIRLNRCVAILARDDDEGLDGLHLVGMIDQG